MRTLLFKLILAITLGTMTILSGGCKTQEPTHLIIVVEGQELSDAEIIVDEKSAGFLTQTILMADGKIFINRVLAARGHSNENTDKNDRYSGCSSTLPITPGNHTITLRGKNVAPLAIVVSIMPGHHILAYLPNQNIIKWDSKPFQVGPERRVVISSE
jgi:hypothetical protein